MKKPLVLALCLSVATLNTLLAEDNSPVSRAEYEKMKADLEAEFTKELKAQQDQFNKQLSTLRSQINAGEQEAKCGKDGKECLTSSILAPNFVLTPGTSQLTLTGGASATFASKGASDKFSALFNPIFLWKINDRLRVEGDVNFFANSGGDTTTEVQVAEISYDLTDYLTLGAGRFANPINYFAMNLRKDWVNKLPVSPGLRLPSFENGAQLHGQVPIGSMLLSYAAFVGDSVYSKAPDNYTTDSFRGEHARFNDYFGTLSLSDGKRELEVGGRIALQPLPGLEIGYGVETFKRKASLDTTESWDTEDLITTYDSFLDEYFSETTTVSHFASDHFDVSVRPVLQTLDLNYFKDLACIQGTVDFHAQWTWSQVMSSEYPEHQLMSPYDRSHKDGYVQLSYRPIHVQGFLADFEPVVRYAYNEGLNGHTNLWAFGLDYWLTERTLLKSAYLTYPGNSNKDDAFTLQFATGF